MGGIVIRSACHGASERGATWLEPLTHVVCLATPHLGAPLEKLGSVVSSVLRLIDVPGTVVPARLIDARSEGIKDLRYGVPTDETLLDEVTYAFIAAAVTEDADHPLGTLMGDMMVRLPSALGSVDEHDRFQIETHKLGGLKHLELQNHPDVYDRIHRLLE